jgi:hypothetical protein
MDLIATKSLAYASKRYEVGEKFEANNRDARILVAIGKAKLAPADAAPVEDDETKPAKRTYKRRDMKAE